VILVETQNTAKTTAAPMMADEAIIEFLISSKIKYVCLNDKLVLLWMDDSIEV